MSSLEKEMEKGIGGEELEISMSKIETKAAMAENIILKKSKKIRAKIRSSESTAATTITTATATVNSRIFTIKVGEDNINIKVAQPTLEVSASTSNLEPSSLLSINDDQKIVHRQEKVIIQQPPRWRRMGQNRGRGRGRGRRRGNGRGNGRQNVFCIY
ncbi:uncharacterized protein LOC115233236 [Formica exsecta]|uniref:uncharacterized protein LOC115233236 n=1 Tax=Formica exsecta TaxID=72781 RepID=UPI00114173EF|nr:uncharacterized protein LOC115233236 [Formica exsecta]